MPASPRRKIPTPSTGATSPPGRRAFRSPSISPPIAAMTATIRASAAMSAWPASRSISIYDMRTLFSGIPLDQMSVSMTMNGAVLPVLALYIVAAEEQGVPPAKPLGDHPERHPQGVHGPQHLYLSALALDADHRRHLRLSPRRTCRSSTRSRFPAITCRKPGRRRTSSSATRWPTASNTCAPATQAGPRRRRFAPRLSFFWAIGMNFFMEVAKMRAARLIWAKLRQAISARRTTSRLPLRTHCQTSRLVADRAGRVQQRRRAP